MISFIKPKIRIEKMSEDGKDEKTLCAVVKPSYNYHGKDIMLKGGDLYAIYDDETGFWETNPTKAMEIVDRALEKYKKDNSVVDGMGRCIYKGSTKDIFASYLSDSDNNQLYWFNKWIKSLPKNHNYHALDDNITQIDQQTKLEDYRSKRLKYKIEDGSIENYDKLMSILYSPDNRRKIEWVIGSIFTGESKKIEKILVLYGKPGSGKSTVLDLIKELFDGYYSVFVAASLANKNDQFSTEFLRNNPLVSIQDDGSLAKIDSPLINEIVSHKEIMVNEKNKSKYSMKTNTFLIMATNEKVDIHDTKLGITRRLLDVYPTGNKIKLEEYRMIVNNLQYELGAIANHCINVFNELGREYYQNYTPEQMIDKTNYIRNFIIDNYELFASDKMKCFSRDALYLDYKKYCEETGINYIQKRIDFGDSIAEYFEEYYREPKWFEGQTRRNFYVGFKKDKIKGDYIYVSEIKKKDTNIPDWLKFIEGGEVNKFDSMFGNCKAQYANENEKPISKWIFVNETLADLDTTKLHYVKPPSNLICIDFDLKGEDGNKDLLKNIEAASKYPKTYAETSKSCCGLHLYYIYNGDIDSLCAIIDENIELKVFKGNSSLRRKVTKYNTEDITVLTGGLPTKEKKVINEYEIKDDKHLRNLIEKALRKEISPYATKTSMDYIKKVTDDAYAAGVYYDVTDMRPAVHAFANNSTHNSMYCIGLMSKIKWSSNEDTIEKTRSVNDVADSEKPIVIFDCEVFENLFVICWKYKGVKMDPVVMENPSPDEVRELYSNFRLVGYNNRSYDNHILYARANGYNNYQLYMLSQRIINGEKDAKDAKFGAAYNLSYTDIYDFLSAGNKMSLKKWEINLKIHHQEVGIPWDKPVPKEKWPLVEEYCQNDVIATEKVWEANESDWLARCILADISGLTVNDTTNQCTTRLIVGEDRNPQGEFVYTDLSSIFPGYEFNKYGIDKSRYNEGAKIVAGKSLYLGEDPGEGGYVYAEPGIHSNVGLLDVASMHPHSLIALNMFGKRYTKIFSELVEARVMIKHGDFDGAGKLLDGKLKPYLKDKSDAKKLANALKTAINSVYGLTSAKFPNKLRDPRNEDNIVAKYGALFMITLKNEVQKKGYTVVHIKTDSIKIENMDDYICKFCMDFAKKYGFTFEHEATYEKMCIVNDAVYIAKVAEADGKKLENKKFTLPKDIVDVEGYQKWCVENGYRYWTATGTQFQIPYVFKTLFAKELPIIFYDYCETKSVTSSMYLDMNEGYPDVRVEEAELDKCVKKLKKMEKDGIDDVEMKRSLEGRISDLEEIIAKGHNYIFIGKIGSFVPVKEGCHGGYLMREQNGKYNAVTGTKKKDGSGVYRYLEAEYVVDLKKKEQEEIIDKTYYIDLCNDAIDAISEYGIFDVFASSGEGEKGVRDDFMNIPETDEESVPFDSIPKVA